MSRELTLVHPEVRIAVGKILNIMLFLEHPMMVTDTIRTAAEQAVLYAQGRTAPGKIVTNCDGIIKLSNHQIKPDGFGHAVDMVFLVNDKPSWDLSLNWNLYGEIAETLGLIWGGRWKTPHDLPHIELR